MDIGTILIVFVSVLVTMTMLSAYWYAEQPRD